MTADISSPGLFFADQAECFPNGTCVYYGTETVLMSGAWNGTTIDSGHIYYAADGSATVVGTQTFTGTLAGCGAGSVTFTYIGAGSALATPDERGWTPGSENLTLVPGSQTTGFAGLLDARIEEDFNISLVDYAAAGTAHGTAWCKPADVPPPASRDGARAVALSGPLSTLGTSKIEVVDCDQARPEQCGEVYGTETVDISGPWNGTIIDHVHFHYLPDGSATYVALRTFIGSIAGCGSGTLQLLGQGTTDAEPDPAVPGYTDIHDLMTLAPGSTTTGFAGLVDLGSTLEGVINMATFAGHGQLEGTAWCRGPQPAAPSRAGASEIRIDQAFTSPGMHLVPDANSCDPAIEDVCEVQNSQLFLLRGTMTGTMLDINRVRFHPDGSIRENAERIFTGSIAGCGSGTLTLEIRGTAPPVAPDLARPGYVRIEEAPMALVAGGTSLGFAGMRDAVITDQGDVHGDIAVGEGDATMTGTLWCTPSGGEAAAAMPATSPSEPPCTRPGISLACPFVA
ncbi:MAG: DUF3224 domain-containing protein [Halobacteriales archaeon]|nr:DUF3224 domain-containing protein [Halobacteriales archaeon]